MSINLHKLANSAVQAVNANEEITLYISLGQQNNYGLITPMYLEPRFVTAQVQSESDAALYHMDKANQNSLVRRFYMEADAILPPAGIVRQKERGGDLIKRLDNTFWLVTAVLDDFSAKSGWVALRAELQTIAPDFTGQEWYNGQ